MRIVIDTNVLISAALSHSGAPAKVLALWQKEAFEVLISKSILDEYHRVFNYPHLPFSPETVARSLRHIMQSTVMVEQVKELTVVSADPQDDKFISCAVAGGASFIVSGDDHLLAVEEYQGILILPPSLFVKALFY